MNLNLQKQNKAQSLIVSVIREYYNFVVNSKKLKRLEFNNYFSTLGMPSHIVRCFDYDDPLLIRCTVLFLSDILDLKFALALLE